MFLLFSFLPFFYNHLRIKTNNTRSACLIFFAYINVNQCSKCSALYCYFHDFPLTNDLAFARVGRVCFTLAFCPKLHYLYQDDMARACSFLLDRKCLKGAHFCASTTLFSFSALCCLSSALLPVHWIGVLQFICRGSTSSPVIFLQTM